MTNIKITKKQVQEAIDNNYTGIGFLNKNVQKRFEKNKKILMRRAMLEKNMRVADAKRAAKAPGGSTAVPDADIKHEVDFASMDDDKLVSAMITLGVTPAEMIDGGVDTVRALRIFNEANTQIIQKQQVHNAQRSAVVKAPKA